MSPIPLSRPGRPDAPIWRHRELDLEPVAFDAQPSDIE